MSYSYGLEARVDDAGIVYGVERGMGVSHGVTGGFGGRLEDVPTALNGDWKVGD